MQIASRKVAKGSVPGRVLLWEGGGIETGPGPRLSWRLPLPRRRELAPTDFAPGEAEVIATASEQSIAGPDGDKRERETDRTYRRLHCRPSKLVRTPLSHITITTHPFSPLLRRQAAARRPPAPRACTLLPGHVATHRYRLAQAHPAPAQRSDPAPATSHAPRGRRAKQPADCRDGASPSTTAAATIQAKGAAGERSAGGAGPETSLNLPKPYLLADLSYVAIGASVIVRAGETWRLGCRHSAPPRGRCRLPRTDGRSVNWRGNSSSTSQQRTRYAAHRPPALHLHHHQHLRHETTPPSPHPPTLPRCFHHHNLHHHQPPSLGPITTPPRRHPREGHSLLPRLAGSRFHLLRFLHWTRIWLLRDLDSVGGESLAAPATGPDTRLSQPFFCDKKKVTPCPDQFHEYSTQRQPTN
ncbi:hypothetical protein DFH27DRAFT_626246 [Peziza echinospora]|nr:hypothetical protein DFH27DRAFT_626246 [Peziza echinospora]